MIGAILCGGQGTRLRGVLPDLPKAMAPIRGRPFLEYQIAHLVRSALPEIVLCVGYRWEAIQRYFGDGARFGARLHYSVETAPLGTAGCLKQAEPLLRETAFILNGDTFLTLDPHQMAEVHRQRGAAATVAVVPVPDAREYGSVALDQQHRITAFREKQAGAGYVNAGAYLIDPATLRYLAPGAPSSLEYQFLPLLLAGGEPVFGYPYTGPFLDIGTPERYQAAQEGWGWG